MRRWHTDESYCIICGKLSFEESKRQELYNQTYYEWAHLVPLCFYHSNEMNGYGVKEFLKSYESARHWACDLGYWVTAPVIALTRSERFEEKRKITGGDKTHETTL